MMKEKIKRTVSVFLWIIPIIFVLFLLLTAPESRAEDGTEAITEETDVLSDDTEVITEEANVLSDGTITVYNNPDHNGHYFYYKDGVPITVYCYHHERLQPSMDGTSRYKRYDYFSPKAEEPHPPVTKEMIATILYLGYPANATGLMERWGIEEYPAVDAMQAVVWAVVKGNRTDWLKDFSYEYDLQYYAQNPESPYFNKIRNTGSVSMKERVTATLESEGRYRTETVTVEGDFTGTFWFTNLPDEVKVYRAQTGEEVTKSQRLSAGDQIYFRYIGAGDGQEIQLEYRYDTQEVFYLKTEDTRYQDMVGTEVKEHYGQILLSVQEESKITYAVTKKWEDSENQDGIRPKQILVQLKADGVSYGEAVILEESNGWRYAWKDLPQYKNGREIRYEAEEVQIPDGYVPSYEEKQGEHVILNTHIPEVLSKEVVKIWEDDKNAAKKRPEYIEVQLKADGVLKETVRLSEENHWRYRWESLPKYASGKEIDYTVYEIGIPAGYQSMADQEKFEITNTILKSTLRIVKKNKENGEVLKGARFKIEAIGNDQEVFFEHEVETDEKGITEISLPYGNYRLTEIKAPEGFIKLEETIEFLVDEQGISGSGADIGKTDEKYVIEIENEKEETIFLPQAGGMGTDIFYQSGAGAALVAAVYIIYKQKEKTNEKKRKME